LSPKNPPGFAPPAKAVGTAQKTFLNRCGLRPASG
jgi:hypothetical protein